MEPERAVADRLKRRASHREILGAAARHHRVDRRLFRRDGAVAHGLVKQHLTRLPRAGREHRVDERFGGRYHGQAVGSALRLARFDRGPRIGDVDAVTFPVHCVRSMAECAVQTQLLSCGPIVSRHRERVKAGRRILTRFHSPCL